MGDFSIASIILAIVGAIGGSAGLWSLLRDRSAQKANRRLVQENQAIVHLEGRVEKLEKELAKSEQDRERYHRISHDMAGIANAARLVLVTKFIEVNNCLAAQGLPPRYPDPVASALTEIEVISKNILEEQHRIYKEATTAAQVAEVDRVEVDAKKAAVVHAAKADTPPASVAQAADQVAEAAVEAAEVVKGKTP